MTKPDGGSGGGQREGFFGDMLDKVKDLITDEDSDPAPEWLEGTEIHPVPESASPSVVPISHHDSEELSPPPVGGSID